MILVNDQLDALLLYFMFITVLYVLRATSCSSSGGQIILIQHLVSSLSVSGPPVCGSRGNWLVCKPNSSLSTCILDGHLQLMMSMTLLKTCRGL